MCVCVSTPVPKVFQSQRTLLGAPGFATKDLISLAYLQPFDTLAALSVSPNVKLFKYCRLFHHSVMQVKVYNAAGNVII